MFETEIPASVCVAATVRYGAPLYAVRPDHKVSSAYRRAADELLPAQAVADEHEHGRAGCRA